MARFVAEVTGANAISRTDVNHIAEAILVPILVEAYGYHHLHSLNVDEGENFPAVDLGDDEARVAIQVTSTRAIEKIRRTLETFGAHKLRERYDRLVIYILSRKQQTYSIDALKGVIPPGLSFDPKQDVWDSTDLIARLATLEIERAMRVLRHLEAHFGNGSIIPFEKDVLEPLRRFLGRQIALTIRLPAYYPKGVTFEPIRQRVRVSTERLRWSGHPVQQLAAARRSEGVGDDQTGRAYLWRTRERFAEGDGGSPITDGNSTSDSPRMRLAVLQLRRDRRARGTNAASRTFYGRWRGLARHASSAMRRSTGGLAH
jgi:hypothetical protein